MILKFLYQQFGYVWFASAPHSFVFKDGRYVYIEFYCRAFAVCFSDHGDYEICYAVRWNIYYQNWHIAELRRLKWEKYWRMEDSFIGFQYRYAVAAWEVLRLGRCCGLGGVAVR